MSFFLELYLLKYCATLSQDAFSMFQKECNSKLTSDMVHNRNCYAYLLQLKPFVTKDIVELLPELAPLFTLPHEYNPRFPYGTLYSFIINYLDTQIDFIEPQRLNLLDELIFAIYHNDNHILEDAEWVNQILAQTRPLHTDTHKMIAQALTDGEDTVNELSPEKAESLWNRVGGLFSSEFHPQHDTNLPTLKNFHYKEATAPVEYRFSTQAQRNRDIVSINPLFKRWLKINAQNHPPEHTLCHVYFNNLGLDRDNPLDLPGFKEKQMSLALHELEKDPALKIAVITLPASQSLMSAHSYLRTDDQLSGAEVFQEFLNIALESKHSDGIADFYISPKIKSLLYDNSSDEETTIKRLLNISFEVMCVQENQTMSSAQKQAIWVHFIKFELTNYIIEKLSQDHPDLSYNFSCKDAIDRGALSSAYFNLFKSIELNKPMQQAEFERALHAAAATVKGRGMNVHRYIIWNAIDILVNARYDLLHKDEKSSWLIHWRDMNCPHSRVEQLLALRLEQCEKQFAALPTEQVHIKTAGQRLIAQIREQQQFSGQRLLLEVVSRTSRMLEESPQPESMAAYRNLASELRINHPVWHIISGLMELLLGALLYLPSLGYSQPFITKGLATAKVGFFAKERNQLCDDFIDLTTQYNNSPVVA